MPSKYIPVRQGVYFHPKLGRIVNHQGHSTTIFWNSAMLDYLKRNFPRTLNDDLAEWLGVSKRTVCRKARELGLQKDKEWLAAIWEERRKMAHMVSRSKGYPGGFRKGEHPYTEGEFKPGHRLTEEQQAIIVEKTRRWYRQNPTKVREKALKAWATRRKNLTERNIDSYGKEEQQQDTA